MSTFELEGNADYVMACIHTIVDERHNLTGDVFFRGLARSKPILITKDDLRNISKFVNLLSLGTSADPTASRPTTAKVHIIGNEADLVYLKLKW